jgi:hypothetical protein
VKLNQREQLVLQQKTAENYTCLIQDGAQGFHCHNIQITLHAPVLHFLGRNAQGNCSLSLCPYAYAINHNMKQTLWGGGVEVSRHCYETCLKDSIMHKVMYFSAGAASQIS